MPRCCLGLTCVLLVGTVFAVREAPAQYYYDGNVQPREIDGKVYKSERDEQAALFDYYFENRSLKYETKLANLKTAGEVPAWRVPYSAEIHPLSAGGMSTRASGGGRGWRGGEYSGGRSPLALYDAGFNAGEKTANGWELRQVSLPSRGLFRRRGGNAYWEGYCSGFTAATIKHPEPVRAVDAGRVGGRPGVVFQPADIKALLSCIYNRTTDESFLFLANPSAGDGGPNMGTFHLAIANYVGRAGCPVGIDTTKGEESWNYPIYSYKVDSIEDAGSGGGVHFKEVQMTVTASDYGSDQKIQTNAKTGAKDGNEKEDMTFNYLLALDKEGRIVGGRAQRGSCHFLWLPLYAPQGKPDATVQGNPYVDVRKVLAMARLSALPEMQKKYDEMNIGPQIDPALTRPAPVVQPATPQATPAAAPQATPAAAASEKPPVPRAAAAAQSGSATESNAQR